MASTDAPGPPLELVTLLHHFAAMSGSSFNIHVTARGVEVSALSQTDYVGLPPRPPFLIGHGLIPHPAHTEFWRQELELHRLPAFDGSGRPCLNPYRIIGEMLAAAAAPLETEPLEEGTPSETGIVSGNTPDIVGPSDPTSTLSSSSRTEAEDPYSDSRLTSRPVEERLQSLLRDDVAGSQTGRRYMCKRKISR